MILRLCIHHMELLIKGDSGLDLFCPETITINPGETVCIDLKINCEALSGLFGENGI